MPDLLTNNMCGYHEGHKGTQRRAVRFLSAGHFMSFVVSPFYRSANQSLRFTFYFLILLTLTACGRRSSSEEKSPLYRPPTVAAVASPFPTLPSSSYVEVVPTPPQPTEPPTCADNLTFLEDLTIPDSSLVVPGQLLDKRWRVQNSGSCNWDERYRLKLIAGPVMGASSEQALIPARSGSAALIRILFTAPNEAGTYRSAWQAYDPQGRPFGDPFFIEVVIAPE